MEADRLRILDKGLNGGEERAEIVVVLDISIETGNVPMGGTGIPVGLGLAG